MPAFSDYIHRLRSSSPGEILHRVRRALLARCMKIAAWRSTSRIPFQITPETLVADMAWPEFVQVEAMPDTPDAIRPETLGLSLETIAAFEDRHVGIFFTDIRLGTDAPDIRQVWEPARLQQVTRMLVTALTMADDENRRRLEDCAQALLSDWICRHPFLYGPHYLSPMECGLRIPVFVMALAYLRHCPEGIRRKLLTATYQHAWWVFRNLSLYNSLGNHTLCEAAGLVFAGVLFCGRGEGGLWLKRGVRLLETELSRQILADGGPLEQSFSYHRFVVDVYGLAFGFLAANGLYRGIDTVSRLTKAEAFLAAFSCNGISPSIGDSDGGWAVAPGIHPTRVHVADPPHGVATFDETGYTVIRTRRNAVLTFDHGPLGMPPLYNHGHADALSITLNVAGTPFFVDPGTYRYNGADTWRRYFKSTRAHNTVTIDNEDQAVQQGSFIWRHPFDVSVTRSHEQDPGRFWVEARHDGYRRLASPVFHTRRVVWEDDVCFRIEDRFTGTGEHTFHLHFHLHPNVAVEREGEGVRLSGSGASVFLMIQGHDSVEIMKGLTDPFLGWYSPVYGKLTETRVLRCCKQGLSGDVNFTSRIQIRPAT